jgi:uncharacterized membrane protein SpoIIM required for sporulation
MAQTSSVNDFIRLREKDWKRLQALIDRHKGRDSLSASEVRELGTLYRAVTSDLALARRDYEGQRVTIFLNQLLTRTHTFIYQQDVSDFKPLIRYFTHTLPQIFRQTWPFTLAAFLFFMLPALVGYRLAYANPDVADALGLASARQTLAEHDTWTDIPVEERPYASAYIMSNNIRISLLAFGGGMAFGLFSLYVLATNGLILGAVLGLAARYGMGQPLLGFIFGHGVIELSVIFIASGAGLQIGWALLNPGRYTRRDALVLAARRAVTLVLAAIPLLIIAGTIEGLFSPSDAPFAVHAAVGIVTGIALYAYLTLAGRSRPDKRQPARPSH